jgi:hypothetical protein
MEDIFTLAGAILGAGFTVGLAAWAAVSVANFFFRIISAE